jgi:hypothetical protein
MLYLKADTFCIFGLGGSFEPANHKKYWVRNSQIILVHKFAYLQFAEVICGLPTFAAPLITSLPWAASDQLYVPAFTGTTNFIFQYPAKNQGKDSDSLKELCFCTYFRWSEGHRLQFSSSSWQAGFSNGQAKFLLLVFIYSSSSDELRVKKLY